MRAAAAVFVVAAAFAWLAARGTVHFGAQPPAEPAIVVPAGPNAAARVSASTRGPGTAVRRRVEDVRVDRYGGGARP